MNMKLLHYHNCFRDGYGISVPLPHHHPSSNLNTVLFSVCVHVCVCARARVYVCVWNGEWKKEHRHSSWPVVMWFGEILCGGSGGYFPGSDSRAWVVSEVISVKFAYSGAPIQTARHHNASPSVTHNDCVPLELVIFDFAANSAPGFLTSQLLTASNGPSC